MSRLPRAVLRVHTRRYRVGWVNPGESRGRPNTSEVLPRLRWSSLPLDPTYVGRRIGPLSYGLHTVGRTLAPVRSVWGQSSVPKGAHFMLAQAGLSLDGEAARRLSLMGF